MNTAIRLVKPWGQYSTGAVFTEMPFCQRQILIERGLAELVTPPKASLASRLTLRAKK